MTTTEINSKFRELHNTICKIKRELAAGTSFPRVLNFDALPPFADNVDAVYIVEEPQGTSWLPWTIGGTYKPKGFYYSNGIEWKYAGDFPFNATQPIVDAGVNNDQFITPLTLKNAAQWSTKANTSHTHTISDVTGLQTALDTKLSSVPTEYVTELELMVELDLKQDNLVSGTNIKTINGETLLGTTDIVIPTVQGSFTYIQDTAPTVAPGTPYAWWDTSGGNLTLWIENGI